MAGQVASLLKLPGRPNDPVRQAMAANKPLFTAAFAFSAAMSVLALTTSFYMLQVYDRVLASHSIETLILLTIIATGAIMVFAALDALRLRLLQRLGMRIASELAPHVLRAMISISSRSGGLVSRSGLRDVDTIRNFIGSPAFGSLLDAPFVFVYFFVLFMLHWVYLAIVLIGGGLLILLAVVNQRSTNTPLSESIGQQARAHEFAENGLRNSDVLEGMGMSSSFVGRWRKHWIRSLERSTVATDRDSRWSSMSRGLRLLMQIILLGAGALLILDFQATGGIMIGASIIGARALAPIEAIVATWKSVLAVRLAWERLIDLLEKEPKRDEGMALPAPKGHLQAIGVRYSIPATPRYKDILLRVDFELMPGESLGIIGPSASGKSTLLRLLIGAWRCTDGIVRLDGADIYTWPRTELMHYMGYVPQDVELFSGTVRDNIARMSEGDPDGVVEAAKLARVHEMILRLPKGYDTELGDGGHRLSGGQSQRIAIARALYGDVKLLVMDEPNSNLDSEGEQDLLMSLADLKKRGVTVVIVAHRPSILQGADKILVLNAKGEVANFGPRATVLQKYMVQPARPGGAPSTSPTVVPLGPTIAGGTDSKQ
ncbi:MAG TPA: type I secretion system permease/ATPase [Rhizomicrobium sp.]|jgi:PrtD family type I secretion system ABC transporter|nr:type I secretion system permease/ATPase [Rhizomicrobium sp.]